MAGCVDQNSTVLLSAWSLLCTL